MEFGSSKHWGEALLGGVLAGVCALLLLLAFLYTSWVLLRRLMGAFGWVAIPPRARRGAAGLLRDSLACVGHQLWIGVLLAASLYVLLPCLTYFFPKIGTAHPWITETLRFKVDPDRAQRILDRSMEQADVSLVTLALALGARAEGARQGSGGNAVAALNRTRDPALREVLLKHGAGPDGRFDQHSTLAQAVRDQNLDDWRWFLQRGARLGLTASVQQPQSLLHTLALDRAEAAWLLAALDVGIDPNVQDAGGASLLDVAVLSDSGPAWLDPLRKAGGQHLLPLEAPLLPSDHPSVAVALAWLQTFSSDRIWAYPWVAAATSNGNELHLRAAKFADIQVRGDARQALVLVRGGMTYRFEETQWGAVLRLVPRQMEAAAAAAEAPANHDQDVTWLVAGAWMDQREAEPDLPRDQRKRQTAPE